MVVAAALAALVVASPLAIAMARAVLSGELDPVRGWGGADQYSADLLSWIVPSPNHPLWGSAVAGVHDRLTGALEGLAYPGLLVLALAVVGRDLVVAELRKGWVALAGIAVMLSLGPFLHVGGRSGGLFHSLGRGFVLPLPFALFHFVPVLNGVR